jgi:hypothetical protein
VVDAEIPAARKLARDAVLAGVVAGASVESRWRELSGTVGIDRVTVKGDRVRSTRRRGRTRSAALDVLRDDVAGAAARTLTASGARVEDRLRGVLTGPTGPPGGSHVTPVEAERVAAREAAVPATVAAWTAGGDERVTTLLAASSAPVAAAAKAFGDRGLATLLLAAAAGSDDAVRLLGRVVPGGLADDVTWLREDLAARAETVVDDEVAAVHAALDAPDLADDAAAALRLRLAELRRLT